MSKRFDEAVCFATAAHSGQTRKAERLPFLLHPMEVASIIATVTDDEDVIIAGILHDVVEDTATTIDTVREKFGERVAALVGSETENKRRERRAEDTWKLRKEESLEVLKNASDIGVKILWLGDKLANARSMYRGWLRQGDAFFEIFHQKDKREHAWYYQTILSLLSDLSDTVAYQECQSLIEIIFK